MEWRFVCQLNFGPISIPERGFPKGNKIKPPLTIPVVKQRTMCPIASI
jgi:hypothetical protein